MTNHHTTAHHGHHAHATDGQHHHKEASSGSATAGENDTQVDFKGADENNTEELEDSSKSALSQILAQVRVGTDLTKILVPVNFLEPRSLLEKITDFLTHVNLLQQLSIDPVQRMILFVKWYLSGWHVKPKGVKKPYNPALGEMYRCQYDLCDEQHGRTVYFAEQVSHHPPISAIYVENKQKGLRAEGWYYPRSKLAGVNSVASMAEGIVNVYIPACKGAAAGAAPGATTPSSSTTASPQSGNSNASAGSTSTSTSGTAPGADEELYVLTWPNVYARGIILGRLLMEYGGKTHITCEKTGLCAEIEFKTKPFFGGDYNLVHAKIKKIKTGKTMYNIHGKWNEAYYIQEESAVEKKKTGFFGGKSSSSTTAAGSPPEEMLFDTRTGKRYQKSVLPVDKQLPIESNILWKHLGEAIRKKDIEGAAAEKARVEVRQREKAAEREAQGVSYKPRFFVKDPQENIYHFIGQDSPEFKLLCCKISPETGSFEQDDYSRKYLGEIDVAELDKQSRERSEKALIGLQGKADDEALEKFGDNSSDLS